ncbi:MAG: M20 family metallopeptidase [Candidatus Acidiferrales bacterium]
MNHDALMMKHLQRELRRHERGLVRMLGQFVRCESPSHQKAAVDRLGKLIASEWRRRGANVRVLRAKTRGDSVRAEIWLGDRRPPGQIMVLGHLDTVYPLGTLATMPFRVEGGRAFGPGTFDMKAGLVLAFGAIDALQVLRLRPQKRLVFFWNSDEEIGSYSSRALIEREARRSDAVLVLEPAAGADGRLKTGRKGIGTAEIIVTGRSAHAGLDPGAGINAVLELALQIVRLKDLNNSRRGIAVQATVMAGGTVSNVVPHHARAELDIRFTHLADAAKIERQLRALGPILPGARVDVRGGINRPPLERTPAVAALFHHAQKLMRELGQTLDETSVGGGSDGNFTAALGVPTLDGLGATGNGAHSAVEHVVVRSLPERAALLAGLLATL